MITTMMMVRMIRMMMLGLFYILSGGRGLEIDPNQMFLHSDDHNHDDHKHDDDNDNHYDKSSLMTVIIIIIIATRC